MSTDIQPPILTGQNKGTGNAVVALLLDAFLLCSGLLLIGNLLRHFQTTETMFGMVVKIGQIFFPQISITTAISLGVVSLLSSLVFVYIMQQRGTTVVKAGRIPVFHARYYFPFLLLFGLLPSVLLLSFIAAIFLAAVAFGAFSQ